METKAISIKITEEVNREINLIAATEFNCNKTVAINTLIKEALAHRKNRIPQSTAIIKHNQN